MKCLYARTVATVKGKNGIRELVGRDLAVVAAVPCLVLGG